MSNKFDFAAADRLSKELSQLITRLDWFIWLRSSQRTSLLSTPQSDNWQGGKRRQFEGEYARQQAALTDLKATARTLQAQVANATEAARQEEKKNRD